MCAVI